MAMYRGALTIMDAAPASCLQTTTFYREYNNAEVKLLDDSNYYPDGYVTNGYYSPCMLCPSGYRGITEDDGAEMSINCCPSGFQFSGPWPGKCSTLETVLTGTVFVTGDPSQTTSTQFDPPSAAFRDNLVSVDIFPKHIRCSIKRNCNKCLDRSEPTASTSPSSTPADTSSSLSKSGKIAIAVVVPLVAIMFLGPSLLIRRRQIRKRNGAGEVTVHELPSQKTYKDDKNLVEVQGSFVRPQQTVEELDADSK